MKRVAQCANYDNHRMVIRAVFSGKSYVENEATGVAFNIDYENEGSVAHVYIVEGGPQPVEQWNINLQNCTMEEYFKRNIVFEEDASPPPPPLYLSPSPQKRSKNELEEVRKFIANFKISINKNPTKKTFWTYAMNHFKRELDELSEYTVDELVSFAKQLV